MTEPDAGAVEVVLSKTLAEHSSLFLATTGDEGPWVSGVYFAETDPFMLVLVLERRGRTLAAVRHDPRVAVVVSTGSPGDPFLQARAMAEVVEGPEADEVRRRLVSKVPAAEPFLQAPIEAVRLTVARWRVTDVPNGWLPGRDIDRDPGRPE